MGMLRGRRRENVGSVPTTAHDWKQGAWPRRTVSITALLGATLWLGSGPAQAEGLAAGSGNEAPGETGREAQGSSGKPNGDEKPSKPDVPIEMRELLFMLAIAGVCGGILSYLKNRDTPEAVTSSEPITPGEPAAPPTAAPTNAAPAQPVTAALPIIRGVVAAEVVPLFLKLTDSEILAGTLRGDHLDMAALIGFGLIAAVYSDTFLSNVSVAAQIKEVDQKARSAKNDALIARANAADANKTAKNTEGATSAATATAKEAKQAVDELTDEGNATVGARLRDAGTKNVDRHDVGDYEAALVAFLMTDKWKKRTMAGLKTDISVLTDKPVSLPDTLKMLTEKGLLQHYESDAVREERWSLTEDGQSEARALAERLLA